MLVNEEQLHFVDLTGVSDTKNDKFHDLLIHIGSRKVPQVNLKCNLNRIGLDTCHKQINEMLMFNLGNIGS